MENGPSYGLLHIYALDAENGSLVWSYRAGRDAGAGLLPSPTVVNGRVYVGDENYLYAFDAENGELVWPPFEVPWEGGLHGVDSAPVVIDNRVYFGSWDGWFYCIDTNTGELIWEYSDGDGKMGHVMEAPAFADGIVYFGTGAGGVGYHGWVYAVNAENGSLIWKSQIGDEIGTSPVVVDDVVYIGAGFMGHLPGDGVWAFDAKTGEVLWYFDTENVMITCSPVVASGKVIFGSRYNKCIYALSAEDGSVVVWSTPIGETWFYSSPAVANDKLFIGGGDTIYLLNVKDGSIIQGHQTGNVISSSPAIAYGKIYITSGDGNLYCFGAHPQQPETTQQLDWPLFATLAALLALIILVLKRVRA